MDCTEFLTLAQQLAQQPEEASQRSAVSRAYYAAYHHCNHWHKQLPMPGSNAGPAGGVHQTLINQLSNPSTQLTQAEKMRSKSMAYKLKAARDLRKKADYDLNDPLDPTEIADALSHASRLLN